MPVSAHRKQWHGYGYNAQGFLDKEWTSDQLSDSAHNSLQNHQVTPVALAQVEWPNGSGQRWNWVREHGVGDLLSIARADNTSITHWKHHNASAQDHRLPGRRLAGVELDGQTTKPITHDGLGRVTQDTEFEYVFDPFDRLVAARPIGQTAWSEQYHYDSLGRLSKLGGSDHTVPVFHAYDGAQLIAAYEQNTLVWEVLWADQLDHLLQWHHAPTSTVYLPLRDHRNTIVALHNANTGAVNHLADVDAQGRTTTLFADETVDCQEQGQPGTVCVLADIFPFGLNTAWRSQTTGMLSMRHRCYSPKLGQFVSHDHYEYVDSFNLYAFAALDPINNLDPWGLQSCSFATRCQLERIPPGSTPVKEKNKITKWLYKEGDWEYTLTPDAKITGRKYIGKEGVEPSLISPLDFVGPGGVTGKTIVKGASKGFQIAQNVKAALASAKSLKTVAQNIGKKVAQCLTGSCRKACFVAGTLVWQGDGEPVAIEALQVDQVVSVPSAEHPHQRSSAYNADNCPALTQEQVEVGTWLSLCQDRIVAVKSDKPERWKDLIGSTYAPGDLDTTDVTPLLWRRVELVLHQPTGAQAKLSMLRPLWWLESLQVQEGSWLNLEVVEAGLVGQAQVLAVVDDVKHDSRALSQQQALVIGTIAHEQAQVLRLTFDDGQKDVLGITPTHPLYSTTRQAWVQAQQLRLGEVVTTQQGTVATLVAIEASDALQPVFNLEVHRAQSYYVGQARLLAHNTGFNCAELNVFGTTNVSISIRNVNKIKDLLSDPNTRAAAWKKLENADGKIEIWVIDGKRYLFNGNHRYQAAKELDIPIPMEHVKVIDKSSSTIPKWSLDALDFVE